MTATLALAPNTPASSGHLRPLNVIRDLPAVADLIELCFSATLDPEGRSYINQMRRSGQDAHFLNWAPRMIESVSLPLSGFVWEDHGRIVGNVSLIPFFKDGKKVSLIANVATHPDYRRLGIARNLTGAALQRAREKRASSIWLHVRNDNPGALKLYQQVGFVEKTRRTTWNAAPDANLPAENPKTPIDIQTRPARDWPAQSQWLENTYPSALDWYFTHRWNVLKPGLGNTIYRFFAEISTQQWAAYRSGQLGAVLACQQTAGRSDHLWLAAPEKCDPETITRLLQHGRRHLSGRHSLTLEFPADIADEAIHAAGFTPQRTLVWMQAPGTQPYG